MKITDNIGTIRVAFVAGSVGSFVSIARGLKIHAVMFLVMLCVLAYMTQNKFKDGRRASLLVFWPLLSGAVFYLLYALGGSENAIIDFAGLINVGAIAVYSYLSVDSADEG